jgi:hypothetical protein
LLCVLKYDLFWRKFHKLHKILCTAWLLSEILSRYLPSLFGLICGIALLIFWLDDLSIGESEVVRSPTVTVLGSICAVRAIQGF